MFQRVVVCLKWLLGAGVCVLGIGVAALIGQQYVRTAKSHAGQRDAAPPSVARVAAESLAVPTEVAKSLGIAVSDARAPSHPRLLPPLSGCLAVDPNRSARVHSRFAGEVVALGTLSGGEADKPFSDGSKDRTLRVGDNVKAGQLLAVVWSKDLGEKKSELVDALSGLRVNRDTLNRLKAVAEGVIAQRQVREAERTVESSLIAVARAEATLRTWRVGEKEIADVEAEADRLGRGEPQTNRAASSRWARVEVRAPMAGVILERNTTIGDVIDVKDDLYKIADLDQLAVWAYVYEDDLPTVQALPKPIKWTVHLPARPDLTWTGELERIGEIIDPNQRTGVVRGSVANPKRELKAGEFITATIEIPAGLDEVEIPTTALVEDGRQSVIFIQSDLGVAKFTRRPVSVVRRHHDVAYVRGPGSPKDPAWDPVRPGEHVVTSGAVQLNAAINGLPTP